MSHKKGLLAEAEAMRNRLCVEACAGVPVHALTPGSVLKLATYTGQVVAEVEFLRNVRELQAKEIRELRAEVEGVRR